MPSSNPRARLCRSSSCSPVWGARGGLADPWSGDEPTEPVGAAGTKLGRPRETATESPSGSEGQAAFSVQRMCCSSDKQSVWDPKIWQLLVGSCSLQFRQQITGSSSCTAHFQRENGRFVKVNLRDAVGSFALSCSWEKVT